MERRGRCLIWSNMSTSAYRNSGKHRITSIKTAGILNGIFKVGPHKYVRRSAVTRQLQGCRPPFLTEFSWFTLTHPNVCLKCLKTDHDCFPRNPYLTIIIILPHTCIKQLSRGQNKPNVGKAMRYLVHIYFYYVWQSIVPYIWFSLTCQSTKARHFWQSLFYRISRINFSGFYTATTKGPNAVFHALHFCYRDLQHASARFNSLGKMQFSSWKFSVSAHQHSSLTLAHVATHAKLYAFHERSVLQTQ